MILSKLCHAIPLRAGAHFKRTVSLVSALSRKQVLVCSVESAAAHHAPYHTMLQTHHVHRRHFADHKDDNIKKFNLSLAKRRQRLTDTIEQKRIRVQEHKQHLIQGIQEKKSRVQEKVRAMEEIVERENIFTVPNVLCVGRAFLAPYIGYVIVQGNYQLAVGLLVVAGITDLLDGFIARTWTSQASKIGSFLDPMADKLLVGSLVVSLSYCGLFPVWLSAMVIFRDMFLIIAGFVIRYISLPPPRTLARYFDATHVTAKLQPTLISKLNTVVQLSTIAISLAAPICPAIEPAMLTNLWYFTGFTTAAAAASYIFTKDTYKLIKNRKGGKTL